MGIPSAIQRRHLLDAIEVIKLKGVPSEREATRYDVLVAGQKYPPKYVVSIAGELATGKLLDPYSFSGGIETNNFLRSRGIAVIPRIGEDWTEDECYLAVWGYDQLDQRREATKSSFFQYIAELTGRTAKAVEYKIQNVSSLDPRPWKDKPIGEAHSAQKLLQRVFKRYWANRPVGREHLETVVSKLDFGIEDSDARGEKERIQDELVVEEARATDRVVAARSRSRKLLDEGRKHFRKLDAEGKLRCVTCGFVTPIGVDGEIVQLHHLEPIATAALSGRSMKLTEALTKLIPLCPNCHGLAHTSRPPLPPEGIKALLGVPS